MIVFNLVCKDCSLEFEGWFDNSKEFEKQRKKGDIFCPSCNSIAINKSLMTPNLANTKKKNIQKNKDKFKEVKKKLKDYQKFIKENFEFVGDNFSYEARSIHYNKKKTKKSIYGNASLKEVKELKEEGIETEMIPWIDENEN